MKTSLARICGVANSPNDYYLFQHIKRVLESPNFTKSQEHPEGGQIGHLFLVGGFAESAIVQEAIRAEFGQSMNVIIPQVT